MVLQVGGSVLQFGFIACEISPSILIATGSLGRGTTVSQITAAGDRNG